MNTKSLFAAAALAVGVSGCSITASQAKNALNVTLDAAQLSCIVLSHLTDAEAVMKTCEIAADLRPTVKGLIGQRAALRHAIAEAQYGSLPACR